MTRAKTTSGGKTRRAGTVSEKKSHGDSSVIILDGSEPIVEVTDLPELVPLQIAVHETAPQLTAVAQAITSAGHVLTLGTSGKEGVAKIRETVTDGQIDVVLVGLPGGESIIDAALALEPRRPVIIAACSGSATDAVQRASAAGADLATARPHDVEKLAPVLLAASRLVELRRAMTTARGSEAVLRSRLDQLSDGDAGGLQPFELFQRALELELKRAKRFKYPLSVALFAVEIPPPPPPPGVRGILRARAGNALIHSIRDIDMATEIDQERFLVLLPYTDLTGAAEVARRIIAAVADGDPVVATGRTFAPKLVGAVAGGSPGQQVSFSKLMRDATRTLEQARKDGADLAVSL